MPPASDAPRHQVERVMLMTRPRSRAGQVSATSIEPSDHSPFSAKPTIERAMTKVAKVGDIAATGINSENSAMLTASSVRRPSGRTATARNTVRRCRRTTRSAGRYDIRAR